MLTVIENHTKKWPLVPVPSIDGWTKSCTPISHAKYPLQNGVVLNFPDLTFQGRTE